MFDSKLLSTQNLENILNRTLGALEDGRSQIFEVAEAAREECTKNEVVLKAVQMEMAEAIADVEELTEKFTRMRFELFESNKNFDNYSEEEKKEIYEETALVRDALTAAKEQERLLRVRRDHLEQTLSKLREIANKAELLVSQVGTALNYLANDISDVSEQIENLQARESAGYELIKGQEIERRRLASALHDGPVQDLANVIVQLEICERLYASGDHIEAFERYSKLKGFTQGSIAELRSVIYDLNPMTLDDLGLVLTIENCLNNLAKQSNVDIEFVVLGKEVRVDSHIEVAVFRIIQEAIINSVKHAEPGLIQVKLEFSNRYIGIDIKDDGIGFVMSEIQEKIRTGRHYGMLSIQNRASVFGGVVQIQGNLGKGARLYVKITLAFGKEVEQN